MAVNVTAQIFKAAFPEFSCSVKYPDAYVERFLTQSTMFISTDSGVIKDDVRILAIEYLTAHLITLAAIDGQGNANSDSGNSGGVLTSASIDSVSVAFQAVIAKDAFEQWIQSTPYGKLYWALLSANMPAGIYWAGSPRIWGIR